MTWTVEILLSLLGTSSLILDTTGSGPFLEILSRVAEDAGVPLASAALYRGGAVARIRLQRPGNVPLYMRPGSDAFPIIPAGEDDFSLEVGCSSPVNNAGPTRVAAISAMLADLSIRVLSGDASVPSELLHIFEPVGEAPFDRVGCVSLD